MHPSFTSLSPYTEADAGLASLRARCAQLEAELHDSKQLAAPAAAVATEEGPQSMEVDACTAPEAHAQAEGVVSEGAAAAGQAELEAQVAQLKVRCVCFVCCVLCVCVGIVSIVCCEETKY